MPTLTPTNAVAVIGLGVMGGPMAVNLARAGFAVRGYSRRGARTRALQQAGVTAAASLREAVEGVSAVLTVLPDTPDVRGVLTGDGGVLSTVAPGTIVIDCSTIRPDASAEFAAAGDRLGVLVVDAPVSGGEQGAIDGTLSVMVGGSEEAFAAAAPVLESVGTTVVHVGPAGAGQIVKSANQLIVAGTLELIAEAIVFLEASGVDTTSALEVIGEGLAGSTVLARKGQSMLARSFTPGFRVELHDKDLRILTGAAADAGVVIPLGAVTAQLMASLKACGKGGLDHSALLTLVAEMSGRAPK